MNSEPIQEQEVEAPKLITDIEVGQYVEFEYANVITVLQYKGIEMHEHLFVGENIRMTIPNHDLTNYQNQFTFIDPPEKKEDTPNNPLEDIQPPPEPVHEL